MSENVKIESAGSFQISSNQLSADLAGKETEIGAANFQKQCIIIHGWNSTGKDMERLKSKLASLPNASGYRFWLPTYDTNAPFKDNAKTLTELFKKEGVNFDNALVIGYSMGGVIARSMLTFGFTFKNLVTICTPHLGLAPWIPTPTWGTMSIAPWSKDLGELNNNSIDQRKRGNYYFFGISYNDFRGKHPDDSVVLLPSAVATTLGNLAVRKEINLDYNGGMAGFDPHSRGMDPNLLGDLIATVERLL